jgi:hypothetical protein
MLVPLGSPLHPEHVFLEQRAPFLGASQTPAQVSSNMLPRGIGCLRLGPKSISPHAGGRCCRLRSPRRPDSHCLELGSKSSDLCCVVASGSEARPCLRWSFFAYFAYFA